MLVVIQKVGARIVRDIKIGPAVVVVVAPGRTQAVIVMWIVHAGFLRNFFKRAIAFVVKQQIRFAGHAPRPALHQHSLETAEARIVAELRQIVDIHVHITRDKKIYAAVAIIVGPGCSGAESARAYAGLLGYIFKLAVAQIVI